MKDCCSSSRKKPKHMTHALKVKLENGRVSLKFKLL